MFLNDYLVRTMLLERLIGVFVYFALVISTYSALKKSASAKQFKFVLNVCLAIFTILAYIYIPSSDADLYRWRRITEGWRGVPFSSFFNEHLRNNTTPVAYLVMYLCAQLNIEGILPAVCSIVFYFNFFSILKDYQVKGNENNYQDKTSLAFFVFMSSGAFLEVVSGIRCFVAFSFIAKSFYYEIYRDRKMTRSIPVYIIASMIHNAVIPIIGIRILHMVFQRTTNAKRKLFNIVVVVIFIMFAYRYGRGFIDAAFIKANNYINGDTYSYIWEYIIGAIQWMLFAYLVNKCQKSDGISVQLMNILQISKLFLLVEAIFIFEYNIFHRMILVSSFLVIPIVSYIHASKDKNARIISVIMLTSELVLLIACARGNLCGYKFFLLNNS